MNYTYILTCADGTFYCGWTNDLDKRLKVHNQGKGAKYTKPRRPVVLSYYEAFETKQEAMSREYAIKHMSRAEKEHLIKKNGFPEDKLTLRLLPKLHKEKKNTACGMKSLISYQKQCSLYLYPIKPYATKRYIIT